MSQELAIAAAALAAAQRLVEEEGESPTEPA
jgi:hypothetical protein